MRTAIIASNKDLAGVNIVSFLHGMEDIHMIEQDTIYADDLDIDADIYIFATRHSSKKGIPTLSCHTPGNWSAAEAGGADRRVCISPASLLKQAFIYMNEMNDLPEFQVSLECTHHGPYLEKPCFFIEIGSVPEQWQNKQAGKLIADVIMKLRTDSSCRSAIGIGGPHYCNNFNKLQLKTEIAIGHICPKHHLQHLDRDMLQQAIDRTIPKPTLIYLDWKGLGKYKQKIRSLLEEFDLETIRLK